VVATCEADALREASFFADRLITEKMPLAGLVLNRTHPPLADLPLAQATAGLDRITGKAPLAEAALQIHADRLATRSEERRMRARFDRAHPGVPVVEVPAQDTDVHDVEGLRAVAKALTAPSG
jgi:anion-transporting  ArsA/GET3 family ATPase